MVTGSIDLEDIQLQIDLILNYSGIKTPRSNV